MSDLPEVSQAMDIEEEKPIEKETTATENLKSEPKVAKKTDRLAKAREAKRRKRVEKQAEVAAERLRKEQEATQRATQFQEMRQVMLANSKRLENLTSQLEPFQKTLAAVDKRLAMTQSRIYPEGSQMAPQPERRESVIEPMQVPFNNPYGQPSPYAQHRGTVRF